MAKVGMLAQCQACPHKAFEHHHNGYRGEEGQGGRGRCAFNHPATVQRCLCTSFVAEEEPD